jgi:hypothetical protein
MAKVYCMHVPPKCECGVVEICRRGHNKTTQSKLNSETDITQLSAILQKSKVS